MSRAYNVLMLEINIYILIFLQLYFKNFMFFHILCNFNTLLRKDCIFTPVQIINRTIIDSLEIAQCRVFHIKTTSSA